ERAEAIFDDLVRFLWGTRRHEIDKKNSPADDRLNFVYIMDAEMREIDQMWHVFLLYTRDYKNFCETYFGEILHHQPDLVPYFETQGFSFLPNLEKFLDYNYDLLGPETIQRWFADSSRATS